MLFTSKRPQAEARRWVYAELADLVDENPRWFFDGVDNEFDRRRIRKALDAVVTELRKKGEAE